jgi:hypothetical protein
MSEVGKVTEEWMPVIGWPEYEVSNLGRVRRASTGAVRKPCNIAGYQALRITARGKSATILVHREVARRFVKRPRKRGLQVNHKDCDRWNPRADNLEWVTPSQNIKHGYQFGRISAAGARNGNSLLTDEGVLAIRGAAKVEYRELAQQLGISLATVRDVAAYRTWKHIEPAGCGS